MQFAQAVRQVGQHAELEKFLTLVGGRMVGDPKLGTKDRDHVLRMIQSLQKELRKPLGPEDHRSYSPEEELTARIKGGFDIYLHADSKAAVRLVQSAAERLKLKLYRFQYSASSRHPELVTLSDAFSGGGIVCVDSIQLAPPNLQFWLKGALEGSFPTLSSSVAKRHSNFSMVITSNVSPHKLWDGKINPAFLDRLIYLNTAI